MNIRALALATASAIVAASVVAVVLSFQPQAQAHDDGTLHIHVTPTPSPTPPPTPLGLNGPLSLDTSAVYDDATRHLVVTSIIDNPPPEGWEFERAYITVSAWHEDWSLETEARGFGPRIVSGLPELVIFDTNHFSAEIPLPDYADFNRLTEPVLAKVDAQITYHDPAREEYIRVEETLYIDLNDRRNWR